MLVRIRKFVANEFASEEKTCSVESALVFTEHIVSIEANDRGRHLLYLTDGRQLETTHNLTELYDILNPNRWEGVERRSDPHGNKPSE